MKESLLQKYPEAQEQFDGRYTHIIFPEGMREILHEAMQQKGVSWEADTLAKAAKIVRDDFFQEKRSSFNGSFEKNCQENYVPHRL